MKKLLLTVFFLLAIMSQASAQRPGPTSWSLKGVADWAQPLTASGTATPTATSTYNIGDLYIKNTAGSTTVTLYRLCASGTTSVWNPLTSSGGISSILSAPDLPSVSGNANKHLALGTDTVSLYWGDAGAASFAISSASDFPDPTDYYGQVLSVATGGADLYWQEMTPVTPANKLLNTVDNGDFLRQGVGSYYAISNDTGDANGNLCWLMAYNEASTMATYSVVIASQSDDVFYEPYPATAPASSTRAIGVLLYNGIVSYVGAGEVTATGALILIRGRTDVVVSADSDPILAGDWVITSSTTPGTVERASVSGDVPLPSDELQRLVGSAIYDGLYDGEALATFTHILLKGGK